LIQEGCSVLEGQVRRRAKPGWRIPQVSNCVREFWQRLRQESLDTFVVVSDEGIRGQLLPFAELGRNVVSVGPASAWSELQSDNIQMLVEEGPTRCVWLVVAPTTRLASEVAAAYDRVTEVSDVLAELPYEFDRAALERALRNRREEFVFCPGAEEPIVLVVGGQS
jgi:hypothetical protein